MNLMNNKIIKFFHINNQKINIINKVKKNQKIKKSEVI
ncbi:hypothetical protein [uncultured Gammaproteobacteria bacterium]|nr:hypothetical protein [uncultured Gammaproteobacteria bacterium]